MFIPPIYLHQPLHYGDVTFLIWSPKMALQDKNSPSSAFENLLYLKEKPSISLGCGRNILACRATRGTKAFVFQSVYAGKPFA
jgi:hypothetical protein